MLVVFAIIVSVTALMATNFTGEDPATTLPRFLRSIPPKEENWWRNFTNNHRDYVQLYRGDACTVVGTLLPHR